MVLKQRCPTNTSCVANDFFSNNLGKDIFGHKIGISNLIFTYFILEKWPRKANI
jgi:hypothetical protein